MTGRCSIFGGPQDTGMAYGEGLSIYEHGEADRRPDLFLPRAPDPWQGTSKRLIPGAMYFAMRFPLSDDRRELLDYDLRAALKATRYRFVNPWDGKSAVASLVDWGPNERTGRTWDISPGLAAALGVETDDEICGELVRADRIACG